MKCPICTRPMEPKTVITCRRCWGLLPGSERLVLFRMHRMKQDMTAKLQKLARLMREKFPMLGPKQVLDGPHLTTPELQSLPLSIET